MTASARNLLTRMTLALAGLIHPVSAICDPQQTTPDSAALATHPAWLTLLHYQQLGDSWRSESENPDFFLSTTGQTDPQAELLATLQAMHSDDQAGDDSAYCRFPARITWLEQQGIPAKKRSCPALDQWTAGMLGKHISIVFASAYVGNPSSAFGHTFIRFSDPDQSTDLISPTLNYTADDTHSTGPLDYVLKGTFGGFAGGLDNQLMFRRLRTYADNDGRSMWEYDLNLSDKEVDLLIKHAWEIRSGVFDYRFFDRNCGYQTLSLLATARPDAIKLNDFRNLALPSETIRYLRSQGIAGSARYIPSAPARFSAAISVLSSQEQRLARQLALDTTKPVSEWIAPLSPDRQAITLDASLQYLAILIQKERVDVRAATTRYFDMIKARDALQVTGTLLPDRTPPQFDPTEAHRQHRVTMGIGVADHDNFASLAWRPAGHDESDPSRGHEEKTNVEFLATEIRISDHDQLTLQRMDLFSVQSYEPYEPFFQNKSWTFNLSTLRKAIHSPRNQAIELGTQLGITLPGHGFDVSILPGLSLDQSNALDRGWGADSSLELVLRRTTGNHAFKASLSVGKFLTEATPTHITLASSFYFFQQATLATALSVKVTRIGAATETTTQLSWHKYY